MPVQPPMTPPTADADRQEGELRRGGPQLLLGEQNQRWSAPMAPSMLSKPRMMAKRSKESGGRHSHDEPLGLISARHPGRSSSVPADGSVSADGWDTAPDPGVGDDSRYRSGRTGDRRRWSPPGFSIPRSGRSARRPPERWRHRQKTAGRTCRSATTPRAVGRQRRWPPAPTLHSRPFAFSSCCSATMWGRKLWFALSNRTSPMPRNSAVARTARSGTAGHRCR